MDVDDDRQLPAGRGGHRSVVERRDRARLVAIAVEGREAHQPRCDERGGVEPADFAFGPAHQLRRRTRAAELDAVDIAGRGCRIDREREPARIGAEVQRADDAGRKVRQRERRVGGGVEYVQHADAVLVRRIGQARAVARQREQFRVPRDVAAQPRERTARHVVVAQHQEFGALVRIEVRRLRVLAESQRAERRLAAFHRQHAQRVIREAHDAGIDLVHRNALFDHQLAAVRREVGRCPRTAPGHHRAPLAAVEVEHPDVGVGAVALVAGVRELPAVGRPQRIGVARLSIGEQADLARGEVVPVKLPELRAPGVATEHEARPRRVRDHEADRFLEERELLACAAGCAHAVHLDGVAEACRHQQPGTIGKPAAEACAAGVGVALQARIQRRRQRRNAFGHALGRWFGRRVRRGRERCAAGGERQRKPDGAHRRILPLPRTSRG